MSSELTQYIPPQMLWRREKAANQWSIDGNAAEDTEQNTHLSGTFDDIGHAISQLSQFTETLTPLANRVMDYLDKPAEKIGEILNDSPVLKYSLIGVGALVAGYLLTGIASNVKSLKLKR
jgi:ABC-type transporter Mla subunit MlaD